MATRGWEHVTGTAQPPRRSKYRNVRVRIEREWFDSVKEADYWCALRARAAAGEITNLRRQVAFPLLCPKDDRAVLVCTYVADFTFDEQGTRHVVDVKGVRTQLYRLKAKWLFLQDGIVVEEI
jgi:hypothetical protein